MLPVLHLHNYALIVLRFTKHVVDKRAVIPVFRRLFLVKEGDILDNFLAFQQVVEEVEQQRFGNLLSEDSLEPDVGERIYELAHRIGIYVCDNALGQIYA